MFAASVEFQGEHSRFFVKKKAVGWIKAFTTLIDLGFNIPVGITSFAGEQIANFINLGAANYAKGHKRYGTKQGREIIWKYESLIGRSTREQYGLFALFHESVRLANIHALLESITDQEYQSGAISDKRLAEIKLETGRTRAIPKVKSLVGATGVGGLFSQYKSWAIPILTSVTADLKKVSSEPSKNTNRQKNSKPRNK